MFLISEFLDLTFFHDFMTSVSTSGNDGVAYRESKRNPRCPKTFSNLLKKFSQSNYDHFMRSNDYERELGVDILAVRENHF